MLVKIIGVLFVIGSCGGVGFKLASDHREEEKTLRELLRILDYMECELQYRITPFPQLCRQIESTFSMKIGNAFGLFALELDSMISPSVDLCMTNALAKCGNLSPYVHKNLVLLGKNVCHFDLDGQIKGIDAVRQECKKDLEALEQNRDSRLRSYQTLGLCAGAALAILLV